jgi:hypothetical protein
VLAFHDDHDDIHGRVVEHDGIRFHRPGGYPPSGGITSLA